MFAICREILDENALAYLQATIHEPISQRVFQEHKSIKRETPDATNERKVFKHFANHERAFSRHDPILRKFTSWLSRSAKPAQLVF